MCVQMLILEAGGLTVLMEMFSHGNREQAELALELLGDLLNPDVTSTEQVVSMQQSLSEQHIIEALALAMHPTCIEGEEKEEVIGTTPLICDCDTLQSISVYCCSCCKSYTSAFLHLQTCSAVVRTVLCSRLIEMQTNGKTVVDPELQPLNCIFTPHSVLQNGILWLANMNKAAPKINLCSLLLLPLYVSLDDAS